MGDDMMTAAMHATAPAKNSLYAALAAAQAEIGRAMKDSTNPAFKSKYADLASVMDACMPALTKHGIAVLQLPYDEDGRYYIKTMFVHGASGETVECRTPLIIAKNDMQGYGSAVTYGRRYALMSMAGVAPEDDDGNAAAKAAPKFASSAQMKRSLEELAHELSEVHSDVALTRLWRIWAAKMNEDNWPTPEDPNDETAFRNVVKDRFRARKEALSHVEDAPLHGVKPYPENVLLAGE